MRPARLALSSALSLLLVCAGLAQDPPAAHPLLRAGPMIGWVGSRSAGVWVQTERPARVELRLVPEGRPEAARVAPALTSLAAEDCALAFELEGLEPATRYELEVFLDGKRAPRPWPVRLVTRPDEAAGGPPGAVSLLAGSCALIDAEGRALDAPPGPYRIFGSMAREGADAMLWLGDNVYLRHGDWESAAAIFARYRQDRALPELQPLLAACPHYAIWDDHDFGPNDSDRTYPLKEVTLRAFARYWPARARGLPGAPGVFQRVSLADVDVLLLDDRWYRDPNADPEGPEKRLLGRVQLEWLQRELLASRATFKLVAGGGQFLNSASRFESMTRYPAELAALLGWIVERRVEGVVFLSGDRHHGELLRVERPGCYPLWELTTSPLTSGAHQLQPDDPEHANPLRVPGTLVGDRNYALLRVGGPREARVLSLELRDADGRSLWRREVRAAQLRLP